MLTNLSWSILYGNCFHGNCNYNNPPFQYKSKNKTTWETRTVSVTATAEHAPLSWLKEFKTLCLINAAGVHSFGEVSRGIWGPSNAATKSYVFGKIIFWSSIFCPGLDLLFCPLKKRELRISLPFCKERDVTPQGVKPPSGGAKVTSGNTNFINTEISN